MAKDPKTMSMRQQLLFVLQMSQQPQESQWNQSNQDENQDVNYNKAFEERRFKQRDEDLQGDKAYRWRMLAHSLTMFTPIKKNKYLERNKAILHQNDYQSFACSCQPNNHLARLSQASIDCGLQCLNNSVNQDCLPQVCPVGDRCRNRRFQLHQNAYVYPIKTSNKGWGLCAGEPISKGSFVMQYVGEVFYVDSDLGKQRQEMYKHSTCTYMMRTDNGEVIDPTKYGNIARFMNHSCDPNCVTRKWTVFKETSVGIFAKRDIKEDEELTFDYQFDSFKTPFSKCYCGTDKCKGYLGLGMYNDSDSDAEELRNANAPNCDICSRQVIDKNTLLLCAGKCRQVFHYKCALQKDKSIQPSVDQDTFDWHSYLCRECSRKKPKKEKQDSAFQSDVIQIQSDPECQKFIENSAQNILLDKVIQREISYIEQKESESKLQGQGQQQSTYSRFYNFYFELCKRLNQRMKEDLTKFKFRRPNQIASAGEEQQEPKRKQRSQAAKQAGPARKAKRPRIKSISSAGVVAEPEPKPEPKAIQEVQPNTDDVKQFDEGVDKLSSIAEEPEAEKSESHANINEEQDADAEMPEPVSEKAISQYEESMEASLVDEEGEEDMSELPQSDEESLVSCSKSQRIISQESADEEESDSSSEDKIIEAPKKESLADIQDSLRELIENLWELDQDTETKPDYGFVRIPQQFNVYEQVFQIVILRNLDIWECFSQVQFYWGEVWGGIVTLKMDSVLPMLRAVLNLLQTCTDLLMKNDLLMEPVPTSANLLAKIGSNTAVLPAYTLPFLITKVWVPKNYVKKLIGYQQRTLIELRKRFEVDFTYDGSLVTDNVFSLDESHPIHIYGRGGDVVLVAQILQAELDKMSFRTISLNKDVAKYILDNIKEIKSLIDPCEIRVKRLPFMKEKQEIKHPFYTVPLTTQDVCLIGNVEEVRCGEQKLFDFCEYRQDAPAVDVTTLSFLLPTSIKFDQTALRTQMLSVHPQVTFQIFEPTYPRKHLTLSLNGKWADLKGTRVCLEKFFDEKFIRMNQPSFRTFSDFQNFTFHKQLRFCFKVLKRVNSEQDHRYLSYWDMNSHIVQEVILNEMLPSADRKPIQSKGRFESPSKAAFVTRIKKSEYESLVAYIRNYDVELCLNCMYVISSINQSFEAFVKTLVKEDTLKEMELPYLRQYLLSLSQHTQRRKSPSQPHYHRVDDHHGGERGYHQGGGGGAQLSRHSSKHYDEPQDQHHSQRAAYPHPEKAHHKDDYPHLQKQIYSSGGTSKYYSGSGGRPGEFHRPPPPSHQHDYDGQERYYQRQHVSAHRSNFAYSRSGRATDDNVEAPSTAIVMERSTQPPPNYSADQRQQPPRRQSRSPSYDRTMHYSYGRSGGDHHHRKGVVKSRSRSFERPGRYQPSGSGYDDRSSVYFVDSRGEQQSRSRQHYDSRYDHQPSVHHSSSYAQRSEYADVQNRSSRYPSSKNYYHGSQRHRDDIYHESHVGTGAPQAQEDRGDVIVIRQHHSSSSSYVVSTSNNRDHHHYGSSGGRNDSQQYRQPWPQYSQSGRHEQNLSPPSTRHHEHHRVYDDHHHDSGSRYHASRGNFSYHQQRTDDGPPPKQSRGSYNTSSQSYRGYGGNS